MSDSTYAGDSPGKKLARARMWLNASAVMTTLQVPFEGAYVLSGEGGDLSVLDAMGFPKEKLIGVDLDPDYAEYCALENPGTQWAAGEAGKLASKFRYNASHMDFCNGLTAENVRTVADVVLNAATVPMMMGLTIMKGREHKPRKMPEGIVTIPRGFRRDEAKRMRKVGLKCGAQMLRRGIFDPGLEISYAKQRMRDFHDGKMSGFSFDDSGKCNPLGNAMARIDAFRHCVNALIFSSGLELITLSVYGYHSKSSKTSGTPFVTGLMVAVPFEYSRRVTEIAINQLSHMISYECLSAKDSYSCLIPSVLELTKLLSNEEAGKLYGVDPKSIAAWKAHATRGSYDDSKGRPLTRIREGSDGFNEAKERCSATLMGEDIGRSYINDELRIMDAEAEANGLSIAWGNIKSYTVDQYEEAIRRAKSRSKVALVG